MPFELLESTPALLTSVTNRVEKHGDEDVPAISLGLKITAANTLLDKLSPTLRHTLYKAVEGQDVLPGIDPSTPLLRTRGIELLTLAGTLEGWALEIDHGIDEGDPIRLGAAKIDKFRVCAHEGGSVDLMFRVGTSGVEPEDVGLLWQMNRHEINIVLTAPAIKSGPVIDGTGAAFAADHPDAADLFVEAHGDGEADAAVESA